jgi:hypothetical protein
MGKALGISHNMVSTKLVKSGWVVKDGDYYTVDWDRIDYPDSASK